MPSEIKILAGDVFSSDADALLISIDDDRYSVQQVQKKLKEHWRIDIPIFGTIPIGDFVTTPVSNSIRKNNANPTNFLLLTNFGTDTKHRLTNLADFITQLVVFSKNTPNVRDIAIQMDASWADKDMTRYLFNHLYNKFISQANNGCSIELFFDNPQDASRMIAFQAEYLATRNNQIKLRREYNTDNAKDKLLSKKYYILRGFAERGRELIDPSRSLLIDHDGERTAETFRELPVGSLIFLSSSVSSSMDFFPVSAIGEVIENLDSKLKINWFSEGFTGKVKNRNYPLRSINEVNMEYEKREMYELLKGSFFTEFNDEPMLSESQIKAPRKNVDLANDYEIGEDYLDIADDVDAFSRIIAIRDLRPPLAIALCGKWGSGKSFFIGKMIDKITALSSGDNDFFCKGIAHIEFNAWSYLDSNLWAGLVTRIFNGINQYVNKYIMSEAFREKIKNDLDRKVSLSHQSIFKMESEKIEISKRLEKLKTDRDELDERLKKDIMKLRNKSFTAFLKTALEGFQVEKQINSALAQNESAKEVSAYIRSHFPDELWADSKWIHKQVSWWNVFFRDFFSRKRILLNILVLILIMLLLYFVPQFLEGLTSLLRMVNIDFNKQTWAWIALSATIATNAINSYKKIHPLFAALWQVKKRYIEQVEETKHRWYQDNDTLSVQIVIDQQDLKEFDEELDQTRAELAKVEFRLLNRLNTEAFQNFIKDKTSENGYRRHQGIVATIRDDFESLSGLFEQYVVEHQKNPEEGSNDIPLERIVLYIDDLDRCDESRVLEVLEAVHLIMALNLFVVVVGIDPTRVKSDLANQLRGRGSHQDHNLPSKYLEKIFQVPFQLNKPSDASVKKMLDKLLQPKQLEPTPKTTVVEGEKEQDILESILEEASNNKNVKTATTTITLAQINEKLTLNSEEIQRIGDFSKLIGSNPRSVKRFVNILRIIRAHAVPVENSQLPDKVKNEIVLFLLALSTGPYQVLYRPLTEFLNDNRVGSLSDFIESVSNPEMQALKNSLSEFLGTDLQKELLMAPIEMFAEHNILVRRFSFEDMG